MKVNFITIWKYSLMVRYIGQIKTVLLYILVLPIFLIYKTIGYFLRIIINLAILIDKKIKKN